MADSKINLDEIKSATTALMDISKQLGALQKVAKEFQSKEGGGGLEGVFSGLGKALTGPVGVLGGLWEVSKALGSFAEKRVQLQMFSQDVGFGVESIERMRDAMSNMGVSTEQANQHIGRLGDLIKDFNALKRGSDLYRGLNDMGEAKFAERLLLDEADPEKQKRDLLARTGGYTPAGKRYFASKIANVPESVLQNMPAQERALENDPRYLAPYQPSKDFLANKNRLGRRFENFLAARSDEGIGLLTAAEKGELPEHFRDFVGLEDKTKLYPQADDPMGLDYRRGNYTHGPSRIDIKPYPAGDDPMSEHAKPESYLGQLRRYFRDYRSPTEGRPSPVQAGMPSLAGAKGLLDLFSSKPEAATVARYRFDDLVDIERDSSKLLSDMRDSLLKMDGSLSGEGEGGGNNAGGGRRSLARRLGIDTSASDASGASGDPTTLPQGDLKGINRDWAKAELEAKPGLREHLRRIVMAENPHPGAMNAVIESAMNRAEMQKISLEQALKTGAPSVRDAYYPHAGASPTGKLRGQIDQAIDDALGGSDVSRGATDNSSGWLAAKHRRTKEFLETYTSHGETFQIPGGTGLRGGRRTYDAWRDRKQVEIEDARQRMDKAESAKASLDGSLSASVDFKNMPGWVKSNVDSNGVFRELKITRSTPTAGRAGADSAGDDRWGPYQ